MGVINDKFNILGNNVAHIKKTNRQLKVTPIWDKHYHNLV